MCRCVKTDDVMIKYGNTLCRKHANNDDKTYHISNKLRELGRLLLQMRKGNELKSFREIIDPKKFSDIVQSVTEMCGWDETTKTIETPSIGIKLGQLLSKISFMLKGEAVISGDIEDRRKTDDFNAAVDKRWNDEISKLSRTELETRQRNRPKLLPLTEDLQMLKKHLVEVRKKSIDGLALDNSAISSWRNLCSSVLAQLILLNRRREGETSKLEVIHLKSMVHGKPNSDITASLSQFEKQLCQYFKRVEIRGKGGKKVPMIVTAELEAAIKSIVNLRDAVGVNPENKYVFAIPTMHSLQYMRGSDALRKHVVLNSLKCPEAVTSTKPRKHIGTLSQLLNLEERELEMLAGFLGHDITMHRDFYRLPEDTLQLAKCGKILLMMDQGKIGDFWMVS